MASQRPASSLDTGKTYFEQQRELLIGDIAMVIPPTHPPSSRQPPDAIYIRREAKRSNRPRQSFEHVLANINKLNRSLEAIITVGNEFSSVEALWSQFENVMAKDEEGRPVGGGGGGGDHQQQQGQEEGGERKDEAQS